MRSHKTYISGITLIEITISVAIFSVVAGFSLLSLRNNLLESDEPVTQIVTSLQRARAQSQNNICISANCDSGKKHGVYFENNQITIFEGDDWQNRSIGYDEVYPINGQIEASSSQVIFEQLSANVSTRNQIIFTSRHGLKSVIEINEQGRIDQK